MVIQTGRDGVGGKFSSFQNVRVTSFSTSTTYNNTHNTQHNIVNGNFGIEREFTYTRKCI